MRYCVSYVLPIRRNAVDESEIADSGATSRSFRWPKSSSSTALRPASSNVITTHGPGSFVTYRSARGSTLRTGRPRGS